MKDHSRGEITLSEEKIASMTELSAVEYFGSSERENIDRIVLQGSRHVSGVKEWGPFEKALGIMELLGTGRLLPIFVTHSYGNISSH